MAASSTTLPKSPVPFGADTPNHSAWRRSLSISRPSDPNREALDELYKDTDLINPQNYPDFVAAAPVPDAPLCRESASVPSSSINDLPHRIKKTLKRHTVQLWILAAVFELHIVVLTVAITLGATTAHSGGDGGTKAAAITLGLIGLVGVVSTTALAWLTWQGHQARSRLARNWVAEKELKEKNSVRDKAAEEMVMNDIMDRERRLSMTRTRSRASGQEEANKIPSFRELTPSPPTTRDGGLAANTEFEIEREVGGQRQPMGTSERDGDSSWTHHLDLEDDDNQDVPPLPTVKIAPTSSNHNLGLIDDHNGVILPLAADNPPASLTTQQLGRRILAHVSRASTPQLGEPSTTRHSSMSPTLNNDPQSEGIAAALLVNSLLAHRRAYSNGSARMVEAENINTLRSLSPTPTNPAPSTAVRTVTPLNQSSSSLHSPLINTFLGNQSSNTLYNSTMIYPQTAPSRSQQASPPRKTTRLRTEQNNALLEANDDEDAARSDDEEIRQLKTERSIEQVGRWAAGLPLPEGLSIGSATLTADEARRFEGVMGWRRERSEGRGGLEGGRGRSGSGSRSRGTDIGHIARLLRR